MRKKKQEFDYDVTVVIMGGGAGTRLFPLTLERAKPAVSLGGKYRLIDIPISNCINSGYNRMFVLTQFNSTPLNRHISQSYHFHRFSRGFVEILAAQQTPVVDDTTAWYRGTADAVRKNMSRLRDADGSRVLILSGDQIYQMDFREILATHAGGKPGAGRSSGSGRMNPADVTLGAVLVSKERARDLGVLRVNDDGDIVAFVEKPGNDESRFAGLEASPELLSRFGVDPATGPWYLGNMGIYVFEFDVLQESLENSCLDFGREVLPSLLGKRRFRAHLFHGYWEDIGTVAAFHEANLDLVRELPSFNLFNPEWPIYTRARSLPASKVRDVHARRTVISDGCIVEDAELDETLLGVRSIVRSGCTLRRTYVMGNDEYEDDALRLRNRAAGIPDLGIGAGTTIENAILDKNCRIGRNVRLVGSGAKEFDDRPTGVFIREGVIVVSRGALVPDGYRIQRGSEGSR